MCRFLAYAAAAPASVTGLVPDTLADFVAMSRENGDGWGMGAWHGSALRVERSLESAGEDPLFRELAATELGDMGVVHLRSATPPLPVDFDNSHPFVRGGLMMAHQGAIFPQDSLDDILRDGARRRPNGTTDSERYFLAILEEIDRGSEPVDAIRTVVRRIVDRLEPSCLNAFLLSEDHLYAICWYQPEPYRPEYYRLFSAETLETYFDVRYRLTPEGLVLASTGWPQEGWDTIPFGHVLAVSRGGLEMTEHDLFSPASRPVERGEVAPPA